MTRKTFTTQEFIRNLADELNITQATATKIHGAFIATLKAGLETGKPVILGDIGRVTVVQHKPKRAHNLHTGDVVQVEPRVHGRIRITERFRKEASTWPIY